MSQENVEIIRRIYAAMDHLGTPGSVGRVSLPSEQLKDLVDPEIEWRGPREFADLAEPVYGLEGMARYGAKIAEVLDDYRMIPERFIDAGDDQVLVFSREGGRGKGSGAEVQTHLTAHLWTLKGGRAARMQSYWERADALEAVGLSEESRPGVSRERFEAFLDHLNSRDFDALAAVLTSEVDFRSLVGGSEGAEPYSGIAGLREWAKEVDAVWDDWHQEIVEFREVSRDQAVMILRATGRAKASGVPLDTLSGNVLTWRDEQGWQMVAYTDPREAFEAVGLG